MNEPALDRLFNLLPVIYRQRDISQGDALRSLMAVMEGELQLLEADIQGLYDNWFIETCDEWVVPYLGDLLGVRGLNEKQSAILSQRARVANTISASRRKGTAAALERLIGDSTGWRVRVVESFERLAVTQHVRHARPGRGATFDVRRAQDGADSPFGFLAHTPNVCAPAYSPAEYNISNIGIHVWRLQSYPVVRSRAKALSQSPGGRYTFDPLGRDIPLFNRPEAGDDFSSSIRAVNLPVRISLEAFRQDLATYQERYKASQHRPANSDYYGPQRSLDIVRIHSDKNATPVSPMDVVAMDLSGWERPPTGKVAVDVLLGRLSFPESETPPASVQVNYTYGFSADIGGGPYDRRLTLAEPGPDTWQDSVSKNGKNITLQKALDGWPNKAQPNAIIQILDNETYGGDLVIKLEAGNRLVIEAADGARPSLRLFGNLKVSTTSDEPAELILNGLLFEGKLEIKGNLALTMMHCTLLDGIVIKDDSGKAQVTISNSIVGPLSLSAGCRSLSIQDSIVDGLQGSPLPAISADDAGNPGLSTSIERSTVFGVVSIPALTLASETIFRAPVTVKSDQGCVRYSYIPFGSTTPARFRCQPDLALAQRARDLGLASMDDLSLVERNLVLARLRPRFSSTRHGYPAYAQLRSNCAQEIRAGADDDSEMGVFHHLYQSQRETTLRLVLDETLRFGLEAGLFYET